MLLGVVKNKKLRMGGLTEAVSVFSGAQNLLCMSKEHTVHSWTAAWRVIWFSLHGTHTVS